MRKDDADLVEAIRAGRRGLFAELVDRHAATVFRLVRAGVNQNMDAEDLAQETFLAAYRGLARLKEPARFRAWLLTIASRKVADHLRKKSRRGRLLPLDEEPIAPVPDDRADRLAAIERVINRLAPAARLVFALRHHEGLSCRQIARMLDLPEGTVYSRLSRAHETIRGALGAAE